MYFWSSCWPSHHAQVDWVRAETWGRGCGRPSKIQLGDEQVVCLDENPLPSFTTNQPKPSTSPIQQERHCTAESEKRLQLHWTTSLSCMSSHKVQKLHRYKDWGKTDKLKLKFDASLEPTKASACLTQWTNLQGWRLLWLEKGNLTPSFSPFSITFSFSLSFYPKPQWLEGSSYWVGTNIWEWRSALHNALEGWQFFYILIICYTDNSLLPHLIFWSPWRRGCRFRVIATAKRLTVEQ